MPWMVIEEDGRYCVHKKNADGSVGETVACHDSEEMAKRQLAALYANEPSARASFALNPDLDGLPEYRAIPFVDFEVRDDGWGFEGLGSPYDEVADIGDFTEEFKRGFARKPLAAGQNTRLVYDHSPSHVPILASIKGGTMQIKDDVKGLVVRASMAKHYIGEATRELIKRGDIKGMSPGFVVGRGNSEVVMRDSRPHRIIHNLKRLIEISLTPDPAYAGTTAELRSLWAIHMAESLGEWQHPLLGAPAQPEGRAIVETGAVGDGPGPEPMAEAQPAGDAQTERQCEDCGLMVAGDVEHQCTAVPSDEQRSGAEATFDEAAHAARTRSLQLMGLTLPKP